MWSVLRGLCKMRVGGTPIGCETPGHSLVSKGGTRRAASTWSKCQYLAAGRRGWQAEAGGSMLWGQGAYCCKTAHVMVSRLLHGHWDISAVFLAGKQAYLDLLCLLSPCCCYHSFFPKHFSPSCQSLWCLKFPYVSVNRPWNQLHSDILRHRNIFKFIYLSNCSFKLLADLCL